MTASEVKEGLTRIANADIAEVFEPDGSFDLVAAKKRGTSRLIKSLSLDKDGKVTKVETYSAHEGHRDMGKIYALFTDKLQIVDPKELANQIVRDLVDKYNQPLDTAWAIAAAETGIDIESETVA